MKKIFTLLCAFVLCLSLVGCGAKTPFEIKEISATKLQKKLDNKESFVVIIERENCPFCEALQKYIDKTKDEHPNLILYKIDSTDYGFSKVSSDSKQLKSSTEDGKIILDMAPYFLYTPTLYVIQNGKAKHAGIGYNENDNSISLWDVDSTIDFDNADTQEFWEFLETYE
jgi:predicted bacteriocin transport accessory protein